MALVPQNVNPLQDYVTPGQIPAMSIDGIVVDKVYGATGIIDSLNDNSLAIYRDPTTNEVSLKGQVFLPNTQPNEIKWTSDIIDDVYNTGFSLDFKFSRTTYLNRISFEIDAVPCSWSLYQNNTRTSESHQMYSGVITQYNPSGYQTVQLELDETYQFDTNISLTMVIDKTENGLQYPVGLGNFTTSLVTINSSDLVANNTVISGLVTQNSLGFVENYSPVIDYYSYMTTSGINQFWKCPPQPVGDAVVYFIVDLGYRQTINTMYIDPLYTNNSMNVYYSDVYTDITDASTLTWIPINKDFTLKKGVFWLPSTSCRYLKLEFTNLTSEIYDLPLDSIERTIQVFPDDIDSYYTGLEQDISNIADQNYYPLNSNPTPNIVYNTQPVTSTNYGLSTNQLSYNTYGGQVSSSNLGSANFGVNSSDFSIVDATRSYKTLQEIAGTGSTYNNANSTSFLNRRFFAYGTHQYKDVILNQTWHQAYFTGIKQLYFYASKPVVQEDHEEWIDYYFPTVLSGTFYPSANTIIGSGTTANFLPTGGFTGSAGSQVQTQNLTTITPISSFKFSALNTDWQTFLTPQQILLQGNQNITGVTVSGNVAVSPTTIPYGIYTISGGSNGYTYIRSQLGGSQNILSTQMATVISGGWSNNSNTMSNGTTISGQNYTSIPLSLIDVWQDTYGNNNLGSNVFGGSSQLSSLPWTFLITSSGFNGFLTISGTYYNNSNVALAGSGHIFPVASSGTPISFTTNQAYGSNEINFKITASGTGTSTLSKAGLFQGYSAIWSSPVLFQNMRLSAIARISLPNTNYGTYRCSLYNAAGQELAYKEVSGLPLRTWVDIEVPYTSTGVLNNNNGFYVQLTQTHGYNYGLSEVYQVAMLGTFYNPAAYQFSIDKGNTWWNITTGIGDPDTSISLPSASQQIMFRSIILQDNAQLSSIDIVPVYNQTPYYTNTIIDYLGDPKVNELSIRKPATLRPMFQLNTDLFPVSYSQEELINVSSPFKLI